MDDLHQIKKDLEILHVTGQNADTINKLIYILLILIEKEIDRVEETSWT